MLDPLKKTNYLLPLFLILLLLSVACKSGNKPSEEYSDDMTLPTDTTMAHFSSVFGSENDKVFRSVNFNMNKEEVKKIEAEQSESIKLVEDVKNMLFYEVDLTNDTSKAIDYAEIKYFFDVHDALDIISVNYYILDSLTIRNLSESIFQKMTRKYGDSYVDSEDYIVWESSFENEGKSTLFEVATKELTKQNDPGVTVEYLKY